MVARRGGGEGILERPGPELVPFAVPETRFGAPSRQTAVHMKGAKIASGAQVVRAGVALPHFRTLRAFA